MDSISRRCRVVFLVALCLVMLSIAAGQPGQAAGQSVVYVIPVQGTIDPGLARFLERAFDQAEQAGADGVILEIRTLGGWVNAALDIRDRIVDSDVRVVAYVRERAWSAGALISLAADELVMAQGASVGAAEPRPKEEKLVSALRAEFEDTAELRGRDPRIAAAMVDARVDIPGLVGEGEILTLTAQQAKTHGYAAFLARNRSEVLARWWPEAKVVELRQTPAEQVARFATQPAVAPLLLTLGFLGLLFELFSPGFGIPGLVGLLSLALFFGSHIIAGFAGWEVLALFVLGIILLAVEAMVPGFGVFGLAGIASIVGSIILASADLQQALTSLSMALVSSLFLVVIMARYFGRRGLWRRLTLAVAQGRDAGYLAPSDQAALVGRTGRAITPLRPAGAAEIDGERIDVVTEGSFIPAGASLRVVKIEGTRVIVRVEEEDGVTTTNENT